MPKDYTIIYTEKTHHLAPGNDHKKLRRAMLRHPNWFKPPAALVASFAHDEWCNWFNNQPCNCDPDLTFIRPTDEIGH